MSTAVYAVAGLTCGYCLAKVMESVRSLSGVTDVAMDLVRDGRSPLIVTSGTKLTAGTVREAVENAGFKILSPRRRDHERMTCSIGGVRS